MNELAATLGAAAIGGLVAYVVGRWQRPKIDAETESVAVRTLKEALEVVREEVATLRSHVTNLESRVSELEGENHSLRAGVDILRGQVRELGERPRWPKP